MLNKPPGLVVHPAPGNWTGTLVHGLLHRWPQWSAPGGPLRPGIVHRLDKDTSGLLVVARSGRAYDELREQISSHHAERLYVALAYLALQLAYSVGLKRVVILDVFTVAAGFVARVLGGAFAVGVPASSWLLVCTVLIALFLSLAKRRHELLQKAEHALQESAGSRESAAFSERMQDF